MPHSPPAVELASDSETADAVAVLEEAMVRLAKLTPAGANARTAEDFALTVRAIAETALANARSLPIEAQ